MVCQSEQHVRPWLHFCTRLRWCRRSSLPRPPQPPTPGAKGEWRWVWVPEPYLGLCWLRWHYLSPCWPEGGLTLTHVGPLLAGVGLQLTASTSGSSETLEKHYWLPLALLVALKPSTLQLCNFFCGFGSRAVYNITFVYLLRALSHVLETLMNGKSA